MQIAPSYKSSLSLLILAFFSFLVAPAAASYQLNKESIQPSGKSPTRALGTHAARKIDASVHQWVAPGPQVVAVQTAMWIDVPGAFSLPVVQQPQDDAIYVSNKRDLVTQFQLASQNGVTGLLAHDYLAGKKFYDLSVGQVIQVTYGDNSTRDYKISSVHRYQKLDPGDLNSDFIDLETQEKLTAAEVFGLYYHGDPHLILQTCLEGDGRLDWGLFFITAAPIES